MRTHNKRFEFEQALQHLSRRRHQEFLATLKSLELRDKESGHVKSKPVQSSERTNYLDAQWRRFHFLVSFRLAPTIHSAVITCSNAILRLLGGSFLKVLLIALLLGFFAYAAFFLALLHSYDDAHWARIISERTLSPIYGRDDVLVGAIQTTEPKSNVTSTYDLGFIPLPSTTAIPAAYRAALLDREDRGLRDGGLLYIYGIDWPRMIWAWINARGGSSITMQIVKNLEGWGNEKSRTETVLRKLKELPAAIQLYRYIAKQEGDVQSNILRLYAGVHKIWTPDTGIRGIEAGARVTFDSTPDKLTVAKQLLLSAVTGIPLAPPSETNSNTISCISIWPKKQNSAYDPSIELRILGSSSDFEVRQYRIRKNQCRTIWRAKHTALKLSEAGLLFNGPDELAEVLGELATYEANGIRPVNPFTGLSDRESVSISKRTREVVTPHLLRLLQTDSKTFESVEIGEPLQTNLLSGEQSDFVIDVHTSISEIERSNLRTLCIPISTNAKTYSFTHACEEHGTDSKAIIYAGAFDLESGLIKRSYSNYREIFDAKFSIGSLAKWPILIAAIYSGFSEESKLCPKSITRNGRKLRRVTEPKTGYKECVNGTNLVTLEEATARSDNLAMYELATQIGADKLNLVLKELDLHPASDPAYELSFGLYEASISQTLKLAQIVIAKGNGVSVRNFAPRLLPNKKNTSTPTGKFLVFSEAQTQILKQLIDAPVRSNKGTLRRLASLGATGGKTGTTNSSTTTISKENFVSGKWSVFYNISTNTVGLLAVASPKPNVPLARPDIRGAMFVEVEKLTLGE